MSKKVLIAGASRGLGFFLAQKYLEEGNIVYAGVRDVKCKGIKQLSEKFPDTIIPITLDITSTASCNAASAFVAQSTDYLDVIINNAGIHSDTSFVKIEDTVLDDCVPIYNVNAVGPLRVVKVFLPFVSKDSFSSIINISSECGSITNAQRQWEFDYCMSKAAMNMATKLLQNYLEERNVKVVSIQPGWMRTDMGGPDADLDPYENACTLFNMFEGFNCIDNRLFTDNKGEVLAW